MIEAAPVFGTQANLLLRGSPDIAANGLLRFYLLHVVLMPLAAILVISIHYYKVSREHGISLPARMEEGDVPPEVKKAAKQRIDYIPDLLTNEVFYTALGLLLLVLGVTVFGYHAPLESIANPQVTPLDTEAPWYFWFLQGMLKLGDKILMGLIIPTIAVILLVALPYIDRNPHRSLYKRPFAVAIGVFAVLVLVVLSYMGTPNYGIEMEPAQRIIQDMSPQEGEGPLDEVPFDELQTGSYEVNAVQPVNMCPNLDYGCPEFEHFFGIYSDRVNEAIQAGKLPAETQALVTIEDWQQGLKKVVLRIVWPEEGETKSYERVDYMHTERGG
jgi:hypothetical protein